MERVLVPAQAIALPKHWVAAGVWHEAEPVEIFEERSFKTGPAANAVVVFDSQKHPAVKRARDTPDVDGIHDMSQVQVPCRGGCEAGEHWSIEPRSERGKAWANRHETILVRRAVV